MMTTQQLSQRLANLIARTTGRSAAVRVVFGTREGAPTETQMFGEYYDPPFETIHCEVTIPSKELARSIGDFTRLYLRPMAAALAARQSAPQRETEALPH